jgi:hypothetical protein
MAYHPRIEKYLQEIEATPTGAPLVTWVRQNPFPIHFGKPVFGAAFAFPFPFRRVVLLDKYGDEWLREALAHELVHIVRWQHHLVASLEQEYDAYFTSAKVRCEHNGWSWVKPDENAVKHYPLFWGPAANADEFKRTLPQRLAFYGVLPWTQPHTMMGVTRALMKQSWFGVKATGEVLVKRLRPAKPKAP